ncbi:hypothetical protein AAF712_000399 [Marasmius tenuissimus]|uniref:Amidohydrolase-related domain-containing protein n=1 Tax=Marasmius tenuissimus TaxID=585030 RepID=A0ABR3AFD1_9AGAR
MLQGRSQDQTGFCVKHNVHIVSTPSSITELQIRHRVWEEIATQTKIIDNDRGIKSVHPTVEQASNLGTIRGARAVGMGDKIGSIKAGKLADPAVFDVENPTKICAAQNESLIAVVLFSTLGNVETVVSMRPLGSGAGN